jgi:signal transduction histidine kinase
MTCFALEYVQPGRWLTRRNLLLLSFAPLLALVMILTNDLHHLFLAGLTMEGSVRPAPGVVGWIFFGYGAALVLINITLFAMLFLRSPQHRWPVALIVPAQIAGRVLYGLDMATPSVAQPDLFIVAAVVTFGVYAIALFGFHILDPLPAARQTAVEQIRDGIVVLDTRRQVLSLNPAAESMLGTRTARARGKPLQELLPSLAGAGRSPGPDGRLEISLAASGEPRQYVADLTPLKDHRGLLAGHLLLLRDVTEQRRAQALLLEQRWAQATLQERELLAQELHDGLAQSLGFLNLQAQAARLYLHSGQDEAAQDTLDRLSEVALEMQGNARELIGNLLTVSLPSEGFCSTLRHALARFGEQTGLHVSLEIDRDAELGCDPGALPPATGVQLLRIVQEALANVRKHAAGSTQISVRLSTDDGQIRLAVEDDGAGFDPAQTGGDGNHFGLQVMRRRAASIGGELAVHSAPGQGTRVEACLPLGK